MGMIGLLTVVPSSSVYAQDHKPEINAVEIIFDHDGMARVFIFSSYTRCII